MTLTIKDLDEIEKIVDQEIDERTSNLPTKDEFYEKMDQVIGELKAIRENTDTQSHQISNHEDRLERIEEKLQITSAV